MSDLGYVRIVVTSGAIDGWPRTLEQRGTNDSQALSSNPVFYDINNDGKEELLAPDLNVLTVFYADGTVRKISFPGPVSTPALADLDGDQSIELIVSVSGLGTLPYLYLLGGDLAEHQGFPVAVHTQEASASTPVVEDLNNDGNLEVIVVCRPKTASTEAATTDDMVILDNQGNMLPGWPKSFGPPFDSNTEHLPAVGDIDLDGSKEIVFAANDGFMRIFRLGSGLLGDLATQWPYRYFDEYTPFFSPVLVDIDNDGRLEITTKFLFWSSYMAVRIFEGNGSELWSSWYSRTATGSYDGLIAGDIDGNGMPEIIYNAPGTSSDTMHVIEFKDSAFTDIIFASDLSGNPVVGDINGDTAREIHYALLDNSQNLSQVITLNSLRATMPPAACLPSVSGNNFSPALGDFFDDGRIEAVAKSAGGILSMIQAGTSSPTHLLEWPVYRHDVQHTGKLPVPLVTLSILSHDFSRITVGATSPARDATITNSGLSELTILSLGMSGNDQAMFILSPGTCGPLPKTLSLGQSCTVSVAFAPTAAGTKTAELVIGTNASVLSSLKVPFSGIGQNPFQTLALSFAGTGQGTVSVQQQGSDPENPGTYFGTCSSSCSMQIDMGSLVRLYAGPYESSLFAEWTGCDSINDSSCSITMDTNRSVQVMFVLKTFTVTGTVAGANGSISPASSSVTYGAGFTAIISPLPGFYVKTLHDNGVLVSPFFDSETNQYRYSINEINSDHNLIASFASDPVPKVAHMKHARWMHTATLLDNGRVLLAGGLGDGLNTAEMYDPAAGAFIDARTMTAYRYAHTATLLNTGEVLLTGGHSYAAGIVQTSAELYNPVAGSFTATGRMTTPRFRHTATRLTNGRVLITGGMRKYNELEPNAVTATAELYDPGTQTFTPTGTMSVGRYAHNAVLIADGRVLITGGQTVLSGSGTTLSSAEIYNPANGQFTLISTMTHAQSWHSATLLQNGKALIGTADIFNPASETFTPVTGAQPYFEYQPTSTATKAGTVLVAGGSLANPTIVYLPTDGNFHPKESLLSERSFHSATLLQDGRILLAGGMSSYNRSSLTSAVLLDFVPDLRMSVISTPSAAKTGDRFSVNSAVLASPTGDRASSFYIAFLLVNAAGSEMWLADQYVGGLAAGGMKNSDTTIVIPTGLPKGNYSIVAKADCHNWIQEEDEENNIITSSPIVIAGSDVIMNSVIPLQSAALRGETVTVRSSVTGNRLYGAASGFYITLYIRQATGDKWLADRYIGGLLPGETKSSDTAIAIPSGLAKGNYIIAAKADSHDWIQEEDEWNNSVFSEPISITGLQPEYDAAEDHSSIRLRNFTFTENLSCSQDKRVTLEGGYDPNYSIRSGNSRIKGTVTITSGMIVFDRIEIM
ncbi:hypothetical protein OR1_01005 [Geobacter sp. OR-1]|nr:hypothetical protein OR1_01005 [Geobacter sp. OR-1]